MYVRDHLRRSFFDNLGFDVDDFDRRVIKLTSLISKQVFPVSIDLESPKIWALFDKMFHLTVAISETQKVSGIGAFLRRTGLQASVAVTFLRLFLHPVEQNVLPANVRLEPVW